MLFSENDKTLIKKITLVQR